MKIWVVEYSNYSEVGFVRVYSTEEKAKEDVERIVKFLYKNRSVEELEIERDCYNIFECELDRQHPLSEVPEGCNLFTSEIEDSEDFGGYCESPWSD